MILSSKHPFYPSFVVPFSQIEAKIQNVIDIAFLDGYFEPTLAILYEPMPTWSARLAARYDTVNLVVVSLDLSRRKFTVLFSQSRLPFNSFSLHPLPVSVGGVLVLGTNGIVHVDQTSIPGVSVALNPYFGIEEHNEGGLDVGPPSKYGPPPPPAPPVRLEPNPLYRSPNMTAGYEELGVRLRGGMVLHLDPDTLLLPTVGNEMVKVELVGSEDSGRGWQRRKGGVRKFEVERTHVRTAGVPAACCLVGEQPRIGRQGFAFVATRDSDSILFRFYESGLDGDDDQAREGSRKRANGADHATPAKRVKMEIDDLDEDLYGESDAVAAVRTDASLALAGDSQGGALRFYVVDNLTSVGPFKDLVLTSPTYWPSSAMEPTNDAFAYAPQIPRKDVEILACSGASEDAGALVVLRETVTPVIIGSMADIGFKVKEMWTVRGPSAPPMAVDAPSHVREAERYHKYLVMSGERRKEKVTLIMDASGDELVYIEEDEFFRNGATIDVDTVLAGTLIVQVHTAGLVVLDINGKRLQEIPSSRLTVKGEQKKRTIRMCEIEDPYIMLALSDGEMVLLAADSASRNLRVVKEIQPPPDQSYRTCCLYAYDKKHPRFASLDEVLASVHGARTNGAAHAAGKPSAATAQKGARKTAAAKPKKAAGDYLDELDRDLYGGVAQNDDDLLYGPDGGDDDVVEIVPNGNSTKGNSADSIKADADMAEEEEPDFIPEGQADRAFWCTVLRDDGELQIYTVPDFKQCFRFPHFDLLPGMLWDYGQDVPRDIGPLEDGEAAPIGKNGVDVVELLLVDFGPDEATRDVYLFARTETDDLVIYKGFSAIIRGEDGRVDVETLATGFTMAFGAELDVAAVADQADMDIELMHPLDRLATRFVRVEQHHLLRESQFYVDIEKTDREIGAELPEDTTVVRRRYMRVASKLLGFEESEYQAVFVAGARPCIITAARSSQALCRGLSLAEDPTSAATGDEGMDGEMEEEKAEKMKLDSPTVKAEPTQSPLDAPSRRHGTKSLWIHPLTCDGEIKSFATFNTPTVQHGFVYFNQAGLLRVCRLPSRYDTEFHWPISKIRLDRTPHRVVYHPTSEKVVLATSKPTNFVLSRAQYAAAVTAGVIEEGEEFNGTMPDHSPLDLTTGTADRLPGAFMPRVNAYTLELMSPITWEPVDRHEFGEYEVVLDVKAISFESKQTVSGRKLYIVVGTGINRSEDLAARGKLYVFEIVEVVPEPGRPETNHKFKMLYQTEEKGLPGPVTQLCQVKQHVLAAVGNRLILHEFEDDALNGIAFIDTNMYVMAATALRNLVLVGDIRKSIWFMGYQEDPAKIGSLGRDLLPMHVASSEFLIDYNMLYFVVADDEKNVTVYAFDEKDPGSMGGSKLVRKAEFHVGSRIDKMIRLRKVGLPKRKGGPVNVSKQHASLMGWLNSAEF